MSDDRYMEGWGKGYDQGYDDCFEEAHSTSFEPTLSPVMAVFWIIFGLFMAAVSLWNLFGTTEEFEIRQTSEYPETRGLDQPVLSVQSAGDMIYSCSIVTD